MGYIAADDILKVREMDLMTYRGDIYRFRQEPRRGRCEVCRKSRVQGGRRNG